MRNYTNRTLTRLGTTYDLGNPIVEIIQLQLFGSFDRSHDARLPRLANVSGESEKIPSSALNYEIQSPESQKEHMWLRMAIPPIFFTKWLIYNQFLQLNCRTFLCLLTSLIHIPNSQAFLHRFEVICSRSNKQTN
jgi:hypothetical protein